MIYGYIRLTTRKSSFASQKLEMETFAKERNLLVGEWVKETVSTQKKLEGRILETLLQNLKIGDKIICENLALLGGNLVQIMHVLYVCMTKKVQVLSLYDNLEIGENTTFRNLEFIFELSEKIQRSIFSVRSKKLWEKKKSEGKALGRSVGTKNRTCLLTGKNKEIQGYLDNGLSVLNIARIVGVHYMTIKRFIISQKLKQTKFNHKIKK